MKRLQSMTLLGAFLMGAPTPGLAQQPAFQPPTATELWKLRSVCAALGKKKLDLMPRLYSNYNSISGFNRYDPATDHCYVEIDLALDNDHHQQDEKWLFDGQTDQAGEHNSRRITYEAKVRNDLRQ
jgi:hypothetical protein